MKTATKKIWPSDRSSPTLLEKRLTGFLSDQSKENYIRLLDAFLYTDVLVPAARPTDELPFGNDGMFCDRTFKPDVIFVSSLNKRVMPVFSNQTEIPSGYAGGKTVFMHCSDWIGAFYKTRSDGVLLNPFSKKPFLLTPDQIRILSLMKPRASEYR